MSESHPPLLFLIRSYFWNLNQDLGSVQNDPSGLILISVSLQDATAGFVVASSPVGRGTFERAFSELLCSV